MQKLLILLVALGVFLIPAVVTAQEPFGEMRAEPNPCKIEAGREECTTHLVWHTRGVTRARVYVTAEGGKGFKERVFSDSANCEGDKCSAPWITHHTTYTFQLFDFTKGDRGRLLASVTVTDQR